MLPFHPIAIKREIPQQFLGSQTPNSQNSLQKNKISLKKYSAILTNIPRHQKSTTCFSLQSGSSKKSIKNLLYDAKNKNIESQMHISMTFEDIRAPHPTQKQNIFSSFFCNNQTTQQQLGCSCGNKCPWMDHWLYLSMKTPLTPPPIPLSLIPTQILTQIQKDLPRTQPLCPTFTFQYQQALQQCLINYARIDPQIGYIQGMNIICSVILFHNHGGNGNDGSEGVAGCVQVLKYLMIGCGFRQVYLGDFSLGYRLAGEVVELMKKRCFDLYQHLIVTFSIPLYPFVLSWLLSLLGNIIPLPHMHIILNTFIQKGWEGILKIIISLMLYLRIGLLAMGDESQILEGLSVGGIRRKVGMGWGEVVRAAGNVRMGNS